MKKNLLFLLISTIIFSSSTTTTKIEETSYVTKDVVVEKNNIQLDSLIDKFDSGYKEYDDETNIMNLEVVDYISLDDNNYIVNMSNDVINDEELEKLDKSKISYRFSYDAEKYHMIIEVNKMQDDKIEQEFIEGYAFSNLNNEVDFMFYCEDEIFYLSDLDFSPLQKVGWLSRVLKYTVKVAISLFCPPLVLLANALYVGVNITEDVLAVVNYNHNKNLRIPTHFKDGYIYRQLELTNWKYGTKTLNDNGCGIVATYNSLKLLGKSADLASIIFDFDYRSGTLCLGYFGSDPSHIKEYLNLRGLIVSTYFNFNSIQNNLKNNQIAIVCVINDINNISYGVHYYLVHKKNNIYYTYNRGKYDTTYRDYTNFTETYNKYNKLIVGYIIR